MAQFVLGCDLKESLTTSSNKEAIYYKAVTLLHQAALQNVPHANAELASLRTLQTSLKSNETAPVPANGIFNLFGLSRSNKPQTSREMSILKSLPTNYGTNNL